MLELPPSTAFNKRITKTKFYENLTISPVLKRVFVEQIKLVYWRSKLADTTLNIAAGTEVKEIEILEIRLAQGSLDESALRQIDREIPYHILFLLEHEERWQAWVAYKEPAGSGNNTFKIIGYYHTPWMEEIAIPLRLEGLNLDQAYENFVRQIAGDALKSQGEESLQESVVRQERRQQLEKQISVLWNKVRKEKQLNKQMQLNSELKQLRKELEKLK